jgi:hypothetical protein
MIRTIGMTVALSVLPQLAAADEVRHTSFGSFMVGSYAASADRCGANDTAAVTIADTKFTMAGDACEVRWIVETIGRNGAFFSAHAACTRKERSEPKVLDVIFQPAGDGRLLIGAGFDNLKPYVRCERR